MAGPLKLANLSLAFTLRYSLFHLYPCPYRTSDPSPSSISDCEWHYYCHTVSPDAAPLPFIMHLCCNLFELAARGAPTSSGSEWMELMGRLGDGEECCGGGVAWCHRFSGLFGACTHVSIPIPFPYRSPTSLVQVSYASRAKKKSEREIGLK